MKENKEDVKTDVVIVEPKEQSVSNLTVSELLELIDKRTISVIAKIEKNTYDATITNRTETAQLPDAVTASIDIDPNKVSKDGYNRDIDIKGFRSWAQVERNTFGRFADRHARMKNYMSVEEKDENGDIVDVPADLLKHDLAEEDWVSLSLNGHQLNMNKEHIRANAGAPPDEDIWGKRANFLGITTRKKKDVYPELPP